MKKTQDELRRTSRTRLSLEVTREWTRSYSVSCTESASSFLHIEIHRAAGRNDRLFSVSIISFDVKTTTPMYFHNALLGDNSSAFSWRGKRVRENPGIVSRGRFPLKLSKTIGSSASDRRGEKKSVRSSWRFDRFTAVHSDRTDLISRVDF